MTAVAEHSSDLPGLTVFFRPGDDNRVEQAVAALKRLGIQRLRVPLSTALVGQHADDDLEWIGTLLPRLASNFDLLACLPADASDTLIDVTSRLSGILDGIEIAAVPGKAAQALQLAAHFKSLGFLTVVSGIDAMALDLIAPGNALDAVDVLGIVAHHGTGDASWEGWSETIAAHARLFEIQGAKTRLWVTGTGFSTWRHDERGQIRAFLSAAEAPAERVYWSSLQDLDPFERSAQGFHADERAYFNGLIRADGSPKLLGRMLEQGGMAAVRTLDRLSRPLPVTPARPDKPVVITGGAGFIGTNLADRLVREGHRVIVYDNLSRPGVEQNIEWLKAMHGNAVTFELADIRDPYVLRDAVAHADRIFHFAAQVAVTTSLVDPIADFEINARGTINLLEAIRAQPEPPPLVFTSTNKVYGKLADVGLKLDAERYAPTDPAIRARGIGESRPLDFYSPYGASKGSADQYVLDYCRTYDLPTAVFRMSCIYGPHQFGTEDQGWVAHFLIRTLQGESITLYGDGYQVRDILFVEDLVDAFLLAQTHMPAIRGQAFNIGGGPANATSLVELLDRIGEAAGCRPEISYGPWRPGDQLYYVSDTAKFGNATGWRPRTGIAKGIGLLADWLTENRVVRTIPTPEGSIMKFALINPNWSFDGSIYFGCREPHLPLEYGYAKVLIEQAGHEAEIIDGQLFGLSLDQIRAKVAEYKPDFTVVTTAPSYLFWRCAPPELRVPQQVIEAVRGIGGTLVAVGPHGSTTPRAAYAKLGVDVLVMGECEDLLPRLASEPWDAIPSLCTGPHDDPHVNGGPYASHFTDLPALSWPQEWISRHHHHHHRFDTQPSAPGAEMETSRGCPYRCSFCAKENFRDKYRKRPLPVILEELDRLITQGVEYVYFIDEIFLPNAELLEALAERPVKFGVQTRIDLWKELMLELLGRAGCVSIEAGVESLTPEGRQALDKNCRMSTDDLTDRLIFAKRHVSFVQANLIEAGTDDDVMVEAWRMRLREHGVWTNEPVPLFPYPGSPDYRKLWGIPDDQAWERALDHYLTHHVDFSDIQDQRPRPLHELELATVGHR